MWICVIETLFWLTGWWGGNSDFCIDALGSLYLGSALSSHWEVESSLLPLRIIRIDTCTHLLTNILFTSHYNSATEVWNTTYLGHCSMRMSTVWGIGTKMSGMDSSPWVHAPCRISKTLSIRKRGIYFSLLFLLFPPLAPIRMQKDQKNQKTGGAACHCLGHFGHFWSLFLPYSFLIKYFQRTAKDRKKYFGSLWSLFLTLHPLAFLFLSYEFLFLFLFFS